MLNSRRLFFPALAVLIGCALAGKLVASFCENTGFLLDNNFSGGAFHSCTVTEEGAFRLRIRAEDKKVVIPMPWYAFRLSPKRAGAVVVEMQVVKGTVRFWPKISTDGLSWQPMDKEAVTLSEDKREVRMQLSLQELPVWIAAQQLITEAYYYEWIKTLAARDDVHVRTLGRSTQGRPISVAATTGGREAVLLLGRQHPPEVTGALAMRAFVDTVLADTALAREFRKRYTVFMVPLLNPDGVALGHWRHNTGQVDLNRDWGPFTQPETRSVARLLAQMDRVGMQLRLMLDFHATKQTDFKLFYTQRRQDGTVPKRFATQWLRSAARRAPAFELTHRPTKSTTDTAKNYFFQRYGVPSITYETADEADPQHIAEVAPLLAEEMMRLLLDFKAP